MRKLLLGLVLALCSAVATAESIWGSLAIKINGSNNLATLVMDYEFNPAWAYIPVQGEIIYANGSTRFLSGVGKQVNNTDYLINLRSVDSLNYVYTVELSLQGPGTVTERVRNIQSDSGTFNL